MKRYIFLAICLCIIGCGPEVHTVDVTADPRFQAGYRPGQTWRLKIDGYLVQDTPGAPWELWPPAALTSQTIAAKQSAPAGSIVHIEHLGYLFNSEHPPIPGGTQEMVLAYGTLTLPDGKAWPQQVTILPALRDPEPVAGTSLLVYPPDGEFLELVDGSK